MDSTPNTQGVTDASKDIASSYSVSKDDVVAYFIFGIALAAIIAIIPVLIISKTKQSKIASLDTQIQQEVTDQLKALEKEQGDQVVVAKQVNALSSALASRTKNSQILEAFAKSTLKKSKWSSMTLAGGAFSISLSADNFDDMAKAVAAYRKMDSVKSAKLTSAVKNEESGKVDFSLEFTVDTKPYIVKAKPAATTGTSALQQATDATPVL